MSNQGKKEVFDSGIELSNTNGRTNKNEENIEITSLDTTINEMSSDLGERVQFVNRLQNNPERETSADSSGKDSDQMLAVPIQGNAADGGGPVVDLERNLVKRAKVLVKKLSERETSADQNGKDSDQTLAVPFQGNAADGGGPIDDHDRNLVKRAKVLEKKLSERETSADQNGKDSDQTLAVPFQGNAADGGGPIDDHDRNLVKRAKVLEKKISERETSADQNGKDSDQTLAVPIQENAADEGEPIVDLERNLVKRAKVLEKKISERETSADQNGKDSDQTLAVPIQENEPDGGGPIDDLEHKVQLQQNDTGPKLEIVSHQGISDPETIQNSLQPEQNSANDKLIVSSTVSDEETSPKAVHDQNNSETDSVSDSDLPPAVGLNIQEGNCKIQLRHALLFLEICLDVFCFFICAILVDVINMNLTSNEASRYTFTISMVVNYAGKKIMNLKDYIGSRNTDFIRRHEKRIVCAVSYDATTSMDLEPYVAYFQRRPLTVQPDMHIVPTGSRHLDAADVPQLPQSGNTLPVIENPVQETSTLTDQAIAISREDTGTINNQNTAELPSCSRQNQVMNTDAHNLALQSSPNVQTSITTSTPDANPCYEYQAQLQEQGMSAAEQFNRASTLSVQSRSNPDLEGDNAGPVWGLDPSWHPYITEPDTTTQQKRNGDLPISGLPEPSFADRHHQSHPDTFNLRPPDAIMTQGPGHISYFASWIGDLFRTCAAEVCLQRYRGHGNAYEAIARAAIYLRCYRGKRLEEMTAGMLLQVMNQSRPVGSLSVYIYPRMRGNLTAPQFGIQAESAGASGTRNHNGTERIKFCEICDDKMVDVTLHPCTHAICCQDCATDIVSCPRCGVTVTDVQPYL